MKNQDNKKFWDKSTKLLVLSNVIIIIFGGVFMVSGTVDGVSVSSIVTLIFFLILKTIADVIMHKIEHSFLRKI